MIAKPSLLPLVATLACVGTAASPAVAWAQADPASPSAPAEVQQAPPIGDTGGRSLSDQLGYPSPLLLSDPLRHRRTSRSDRTRSRQVMH